MIRSWKKYLRKIKCLSNKHDWHYTGSELVRVVNQGGFFRFCPHCGKKQERIIFDFGTIIIWKKIKELTPEEFRLFNLNQLEID